MYQRKEEENFVCSEEEEKIYSTFSSTLGQLIPDIQSLGRAEMDWSKVAVGQFNNFTSYHWV